MTEPLRVLQLYPKSDYFTGAAVQLLGLSRGLHARGHQVVVATRSGGAWAEKCAAAGLPYHAVPMRSELDIKSVAPLVRILKRHRIQIVHAQKGRARTLAMAQCRPRRTRRPPITVNTVRGSRSHHTPSKAPTTGWTLTKRASRGASTRSRA